MPILSLMVADPKPLKLAFEQFRAWIDATGPDALRAEILFDDNGYFIAFGPDVRHALWRTIGIGEAGDRMVIGVTYNKSIDSRHPHLESIADYCSTPIAPVLLGGVHYVGPEGQQGDARWLRPIPDLAPILLLHLPIYRTRDEVPIESGLVTKGNMPDRTELARGHSSRQEERISASGLARERERELQGLVPATLHLLRSDSTCKAILAELESSGFSRWQLEQAVINQRLWSLATKTGRYTLKRSETVHKYLEDFLELDSPKLEKLFADREAILEQAARDGQYLLKQKGEVNLPDDTTGIQDRLQALGLLRDGT